MTPVSTEWTPYIDQERMPLLTRVEPKQSVWTELVPADLKHHVNTFLDSPSSPAAYMRLRCALVPLLIMNTIPHADLANLVLYCDLMFLMDQGVRQVPDPEELSHYCDEAQSKWLAGEFPITPFAERDYAFVHLVPLPTDIYAESTGEAHALLTDIDDFNRDPSEEKARSILSKCLHFKTIDADDKTRLLCCLIQEPNLHLHLLLRKRLGIPCRFIPEEITEPVAEDPRSIDECTLRVRSALAQTALNHDLVEYPSVRFEPLQPSLNLKEGRYESYLTVVLNIFTGKVTAHTDLVHWKKHKDPALPALAEVIWRQIQNGSLDLEVDRADAIWQLSRDLKALLRSFGADESLNLYGMDPHLFTLKAIEEFVAEKFRPMKGVDPAFMACVICQNLLGLVALSRPMDRQVLGIGADHDGSVSHCHTGNARFYRVHVDTVSSQREFDSRVRRYAEFLQGPMQSMMSASQAIKPEVVSAFLYGGHLNLAFGKSQLEELLYQTMVAEVSSDLFPHSLDLFSHVPSGRHKQYSKVIVEGTEALIESDRGCYRANGEAVPYVIYPGTIQPVPFNAPSSEACASTGLLTNPFNPWDHRASQHGLVSGLPVYERKPFEPRIHRDPESKGQTICINSQRHHELKGFMPNNLVKRMTKLSQSCSSFVFLMLQTGYLATYCKGFDRDMDALRAEFLPAVPFDGIAIDLTKPYAQVRMDFQRQAIGLIESIWQKSKAVEGITEKYQDEILPYILATVRGQRLSRPELCKMRTLSQLHCLQSEEDIQLLGRFINWFFPAPTDATAAEMELLLKDAFQLLKRTDSYKDALAQVKRHFDISPMQTSPGLLLDLFEKERMSQISLLPTFPRYMLELSRIVRQALETSRFDPYGYQTDPSRIRSAAIDLGPKSVGFVRRVVQAALSPIHLISRLFLPRANNRNVLTSRVSLLSAKRVSYSAEAPLPNWRSQQVEAFETETYARLCDLVEAKVDVEQSFQYFYQSLNLGSYETVATELKQQLAALSRWKEPLAEKALSRALREIRFRSATEKSVQKDIGNGKKLLKGDRADLELFEQQILKTMALLRDTMLNLKSAFLDIHADLCDRAGPNGQESARNRMYGRLEALRKDIKERRLWSAGEWSEEVELAEDIALLYSAFHERFNAVVGRVDRDDAVEAMLGSLTELWEAVKQTHPQLAPATVLDYPLFHVLLVLLDHCANTSDNRVALILLSNPAVREWTRILFELPGEEFITFLDFLKGDAYLKKLQVLKGLLLAHPDIQGTKPESSMLIQYFINQMNR